MNTKITIEKPIVKVAIAPKKEDILSEPYEDVVANVKMSDDAPARMKVLRSEGRKWYMTVVYDNASSKQRPVALFCHTNSHEKTAQTSDAVDRVISLARQKGISEEYIADVEKKIAHEPNVTRLTRVISLLLRHGVLIKNIVKELDQMEDVYVNSFLFQIKKFLANYIKDGEVAGACTECGGQIIYSGGCFLCAECGNSKCG